MIYVIICLVLIIGFLGYKLKQKQTIDQTELEEYQKKLIDVKAETDLWKDQVKELTNRANHAKEEYEYEKYKYDECKKDLQAALDTYNDVVDNKMKEVDNIIEDTTKRRMDQLQKLLEEAKAKYNLQLQEYEAKRLAQTEDIKNSCIEAENQYFDECNKIRTDTEYLRQQYEALLEPIKQYRKDKQEKYFYTIQLPEEFQEDIEFLLVTVAAKVQHPDIISKLVWAEYVKPNLDNTFKRIEIKPEPGIYKLTSLENGMAYIGKSTDVKKRIADHFKSSIGIKSIADQAVHHAILKEGFWNWTIEVITYADKDKLNELEKYYIDFFKTQEFGYNKTGGG